MKNLLFVLALLCWGALGLADGAEARPGGCIKGAIVGGIVGHFMGHSGVGAAAGCAYGHQKRETYDREQQHEGRSTYDGRNAAQHF